MWKEVYVVQGTQMHSEETSPCVLLVYGVYSEVHGGSLAWSV